MPLSVNFHKRVFYGINTDHAFNEAEADFLHCKVQSPPFNFLGLPVGKSPLLSSTWEPVLNKFHKRLATWMSKLTLINSVLPSLSVNYLSMSKAPKKILNEHAVIQRRFLWHGVSENRKINWLKWESICKPEGHSGLCNIPDFQYLDML